jgi:hypothetical protein
MDIRIRVEDKNGGWTRALCLEFSIKARKTVEKRQEGLAE